MNTAALLAISLACSISDTSSTTSAGVDLDVDTASDYFSFSGLPGESLSFRLANSENRNILVDSDEVLVVNQDHDEIIYAVDAGFEHIITDWNPERQEGGFIHTDIAVDGYGDIAIGVSVSNPEASEARFVVHRGRW
jgi:hypothetical protein